MTSPPKVFVSYSHDSEVHKDWVAEFATLLRGYYIDATLDIWDAKSSLTWYMESIRAADKVVLVCTPEYKK